MAELTRYPVDSRVIEVLAARLAESAARVADIAEVFVLRLSIIWRRRIHLGTQNHLRMF